MPAKISTNKVDYEPEFSTSKLISFPDLLWTTPKARSGKVRKFVFLDWLLHLTPVQSPLWKLTRFSGANFLQTGSSSNLEISAVGKNEKPIGKDERRKDLEVICHLGLNNFCNMIIPLPKSQTRHPARGQAPLHLPHMLFWHKTLQTPPPVGICFFFFAFEVAQSPQENSMSGANARSVLVRFGDNNWEKGKDFVKTFYVKNLCGRWSGAWARARWMTRKMVRSCREKRIETKLCKSR